MATFLSLFSPTQLAALQARSGYTTAQASSATGTVVQSTDLAEFYLDDPNALFVTNGVQEGDIVQITAGPISPLGYYTVSSLYFDPNEDASTQRPWETRLVLDGYPTVGGPVTYTVFSGSSILAEIARITESKSRIENVANPEVLERDALFLNFHDKFNIVCNHAADTHKWLKGLDRSRVTAALINTSAQGTSFTVLFPLNYFNTHPNRVTVFLLYPPIDPFTIAFADSEQEGKDEEEAEAPSVPLIGPLTATYIAALNKEDAALVNQDAALAALQAEIADNDTTAEAGDLNVLYTALSATVAAARASIQDRRDDIADIFTADKARPNVGGLNYGTFAALQAEIDAQAAVLVSAPYQEFLDRRYTYLDLIVNRAFGTRNEYYGNLRVLSFEAQRQATLVDELETDRDLLELP